MEKLRNTLDQINARAVVIGHTPQMSGVNCECDGRVWRVDAGMSSGVLDAAPQVCVRGSGCCLFGWWVAGGEGAFACSCRCRLLANSAPAMPLLTLFAPAPAPPPAAGAGV